MAGRHLHHQSVRIWVTVRDADGRELSRHRADGLVGSPMLYGMMVDGLRSKLQAGERLDSADADAAHERLLALRDT